MLVIAIFALAYCIAYLCVCIKNKASRVNSAITLALGAFAAILALSA